MIFFFRLLNTKEDILKNMGSPHCWWTPLASIVREKYTMEVNGVQSTVWLPTFFKISYFLFNRRKKLIQV